MKRILFPTLIILILLPFILLRRSNKTYVKLAGITQGTTYHITYESKDTVNLYTEIEDLLSKFDSSLSTYSAGSIISRINNNDTSVIVDNLFKEVFNKALEINKISGGAFDITVAPLVNAWGFGNTKRINFDSTVIDTLLQFVGMEKISLDGNKIVKENKKIKLDVNAIAQGYAVDVVAKFIENLGIRNYIPQKFHPTDEIHPHVPADQFQGQE